MNKALLIAIPVVAVVVVVLLALILLTQPSGGPATPSALPSTSLSNTPISGDGITPTMGCGDYINTDYTFCMAGPAGWSKMTDTSAQDSTTLVAYTGPIDSVGFTPNLIVGAAETDIKLEEVTSERIEQLLSAGGLPENVNVLEIKGMVIGNKFAKEAITTYDIDLMKARGQSGIMNVKVSQFFTIKDSVLYLFTYTASTTSYDQHYGGVKASIASLKFF